MTNDKLKIAVLCGGQSAEHEVSLESAKNVINALDPQKYQVFVIFISRTGEWWLLDSPAIILNNPSMVELSDAPKGTQLALVFGHHQPFSLIGENRPLSVDVVFPVLHGARGEDGTMQGLLTLLNIPYVGPATLSSALCMDKDVTKNLLSAAGIAVADWLMVRKNEISQLSFTTVVETVGLPFFIKPASTGSSIGISKVKNASEFVVGLQLAAQYDHKIILERYIPGHEIECAVLGNEKPVASLPGEIIPHHEFYTYQAKYLDPNGASLKTPADLSQPIVAKIQALACQVFTLLCCAGMARIDFFLTADEQLWVNEVNTIPGFTQISMYPKLWEVTGLSYSALIDRLIELACATFQTDAELSK